MAVSAPAPSIPRRRARAAQPAARRPRCRRPCRAVEARRRSCSCWRSRTRACIGWPARRWRSSTRPVAASSASAASCRSTPATRCASSCTARSSAIQRREWVRVDAILPVKIKGIDEPIERRDARRSTSPAAASWSTTSGTCRSASTSASRSSSSRGGQPIRALGRVVRVAGPEREGHPHRLDLARGRGAPDALRPRA